MRWAHTQTYSKPPARSSTVTLLDRTEPNLQSGVVGALFEPMPSHSSRSASEIPLE